jgi:23S rRNA (cytidine1920-2'-O)/16S rRNA (cytidine1409-2'-O)-methyltransferase
MILAGSVVIGDRTVDKPGTLVSDEDAVRIRGELSPYVSRGGQKLEGALDSFGISPAGKVVLDIGASTGGFTDCLLQRGAGCVHALDVGYGQLAWTLRQDARVVCHERTNIRHVKPEAFPEPFDLITIDVSFISLTLVLPVAVTLLGSTGEVVALIKPQFEVGKGEVGKKGVVRDPEKHRSVVEKIEKFAVKIGLAPSGVIESPLQGPMGNKEFLIHLKRPACHEPS